MIDFKYLVQPSKKYTFEMPKVKKWLESWSFGKVLNLFAGKVHLKLNETRIDISNEFNPDICIDAFNFVKGCIKDRWDTIIFDPPYNLRKAREKYNGKYIGKLMEMKKEFPRILIPGGRIISFGYNSSVMGKKRGFEIIALCLICHPGDQNDTIGIVEEFRNHKITEEFL